MKTLPVPHTSRELLEIVAGKDHAVHSVTKRDSSSKTNVIITCSCGEIFDVPANVVTSAALRNVPEAVRS